MDRPNDVVLEKTMSWTNPLIKKGVIKQIGAEVTPFVFKDRFYLLENFTRAQDFPGCDPHFKFHEDGFRIRDVAKDTVISVPLLNHYYAAAFVWSDRVYAFCVDYGWSDRRELKTYKMLFSDDLITWSKPEVIIQANPDEQLCNNGVTHDGRRFVILIETSDPRWPIYTFKFYESRDLLKWSQIPDAYYGVDKYVGGPALYFVGGYYYVTYVNSEGPNKNGNHCYCTRIARSKDLLTWEDAPKDRKFVDYNPNYQTNPENYPGVFEINASDVELCEWKGKTIAYFVGGNQLGCADMQWAEFEGKLQNLFEAFFE